MVLSEGVSIPALLVVAELIFIVVPDNVPSTIDVLSKDIFTLSLSLSTVISVAINSGILSTLYFKALPSEALNLLFKAFCVAVDIGLLASEVLSTLPNPT
nr:MAG TPA: hypothetical protein [Caudoviricetes sp.]